MAYDWMADNINKFNRQAWHNETLLKLEYYESAEIVGINITVGTCYLEGKDFLCGPWQC
jgi:hypothetical protein